MIIDRGRVRALVLVFVSYAPAPKFDSHTVALLLLIRRRARKFGSLSSFQVWRWAHPFFPTTIDLFSSHIIRIQRQLATFPFLSPQARPLLLLPPTKRAHRRPSVDCCLPPPTLPILTLPWAFTTILLKDIMTVVKEIEMTFWCGRILRSRRIPK